MIPGRRFEIDVDEDGTQDDAPRPGAHVGDILERKPATPTPPAPPSLKSKSGFPEHRKRTVESRFTQQKRTSTPTTERTARLKQDNISANVATDGKAKSWEEEEKQRIDSENRQRLAHMSPEEIEEERRELMSSLSPGLLERLLQRASIHSGSSEQSLTEESPSTIRGTKTTEDSKLKTVSFAEPETTDDAKPTIEPNNETDNQEIPPSDLPAHDSIHFPRPPQPPDLDPSSPTFLQDLHTKYFPSLPSDPEKLSWMQSSTPASNSYSASASALSPKDLRFSFQGELLPPTTAAQIPVTAGLHHHGDAPDAAGYTIPELAHLAQSSYAAQRCIAFQTLGRILYRLGKGEFGDSGEAGIGTVGAEETFGELARGLWGEVEREKVVEILVRESEGKGVDRGRHVSAKAYATEAVWLWRRGGGRRWKAE